MTITTWKSPQGRISVITSGRKGMDKVVESAFDAIDNGEEVILMNERSDTCTLDDSLFLHGVYNVKFAIRQFAKGERVTGAVVLNGKEYPVVKAEVRRAEEERNRAMSYVNAGADAIDAAVETKIEIVNNADETAEINERRFLVSVHYDNNGANGMASKHFATAAEAANYIIAFAKENPECVINTDTNILDFDAHKKYTLTDADLHSLNSKPAAEETAEINAADVKINVADNGKVIEQIKVDVDTAINIINRLNYRNDTFVYRHATFDDYDDIKYRHFDAYKDNGEKDAFAITEIVVDGKLETVRFFNLFRDITVDLQSIMPPRLAKLTLSPAPKTKTPATSRQRNATHFLPVGELRRLATLQSTPPIKKLNRLSKWTSARAVTVGTCRRRTASGRSTCPMP